MIASLARWIVALQPQPRPRRIPHLRDVAFIRQQLVQTIEDCVHSAPALRLRRQIERARSPQELWLLRNDAFQLISQRHSQRVAHQRIDGLSELFEEWLEPKQFTRSR